MINFKEGVFFMEAKFTVGEFAKLYGMQKQTLIFYDKIDLFKPKIVDENNGYRYYTSDQLELLDSILILKEIGVPLKEIQSFLENRDNKKALILLKEQREKLKEQELNIKRIIKRLDKKINTIEDLDIEINTIVFKEVEKDYLSVEKVKPPYELLETDMALKNLLKNATDKKYMHNYQIGVMIPKKNLLKEQFTTADYVFTPVDKKSKEKNILVKEKGIYAIGYHKGEYSKVGQTYRKIIEKINNSNYEIDGYSYEYCILDSLTSSSAKDYITKIEIKVIEKDKMEL